MKAVMKVAPGVGNVEVREIEEPRVQPGQVKIRVQAAGICGTDLPIYKDEFRSWPPVVLGHEIAGEIAGLGEGALVSEHDRRPRAKFLFINLQIGATHASPE